MDEFPRRNPVARQSTLTASYAADIRPHGRVVMYVRSGGIRPRDWRGPVTRCSRVFRPRAHAPAPPSPYRPDRPLPSSPHGLRSWGKSNGSTRRGSARPAPPHHRRSVRISAWGVLARRRRPRRRAEQPPGADDDRQIDHPAVETYRSESARLRVLGGGHHAARPLDLLR